MKIQQLFSKENVLDFDFNPEKELISILTPEKNNLYRLKQFINQNLCVETKFRVNAQNLQNQQSIIEQLVHISINNRQIFKQIQNYFYITPFILQKIFFILMTLFTKQSTCFHLFRERNLINKFCIDLYGLVCFSSGNSIFLSKYLNSYKQFDSNANNSNSSMMKGIFKNNFAGTKKLHNLNELVHNNSELITSFYLKNSLLISGSDKGQITLWDINKAKHIYSPQYLKYPITQIGTYLDFKQSNLYFANYGDSENLIICDIRTNKPIKILNKFGGRINSNVSKNGLLVGVDRSHIDFIDITKNFKSYRIEKQLLFEQQTHKKPFEKVQINKNIHPRVEIENDKFVIGLFHEKNNINKSIDQGYLRKYKNSVIFNKKVSISHISNKYSPRQLSIKSQFENKQKQNEISFKQNKQNRQMVVNRNTQRTVQKLSFHKKDELQKKFQCDIRSSFIDQNQLILGQSDGKIKVLKYNKIDFDLLTQLSIKKNLIQIDTCQKSPVIKVVPNYLGSYALSENGKLYQIENQ